MRNRVLTLLFILALSPIASLAGESPSARFNGFLSTLSTATSLSQLRPYFSQEGWNRAYGDVAQMSVEEEIDMLKATAEDFKGWTVQSEKLKDGKAMLVVGPAKGQTTDIVMIMEGGVWVLDR